MEHEMAPSALRLGWGLEPGPDPAMARSCQKREGDANDEPQPDFDPLAFPISKRSLCLPSTLLNLQLYLIQTDYIRSLTGWVLSTFTS